jgi:hypothetical protein
VVDDVSCQLPAETGEAPGGDSHLGKDAHLENELQLLVKAKERPPGEGRVGVRTAYFKCIHWSA